MSAQSSWLVSVLVVVVLVASVAVAIPVGSHGSAPRAVANDDEVFLSADKLNVHIVPHTHDDVGWLKTVDEYYTGKNNSIQQASVHRIITSVVESLSKNKARKFIYVEMAFFWRWWQEQDEATRTLVKSLVQGGQLEFINGGWCMHDEASPHFQNMIDQTTEGHAFLKSTFDAAPRIQWQIDPFGHSSANAELSLQMGMEGLFFARADYADYGQRVDRQEMELQWHASKSRPQDAMFTHVLFDHYGPPRGFDWDVYSGDEPIQDDPLLEDYNVDSRIADFKAYCLDMAKHFRTNNIILTMGSDFQYRQSEDWYDNLDKLIKYANAEGTLNVFYSTPSIYTDAVKKAFTGDWPQKSDDFFPYGDNAHAYWTGYFSSRAALKRYDRYGMNYNQACKQIEANSASANASTTLRQAMGVNQHHDAVSGTEKQHVAFDYAKRIANGITKCEAMMGQELGSLASVGTSLANCHLLNVSVCQFTVAKSGTTTLVVYNSLASSRTEFIRLPALTAKGFAVTNAQGTLLTTQVTKNTAATLHLGSIEGGAANTGNYSVTFEASLPPLGFSTFELNLGAASTHPFAPHAAPNGADIKLENAALEVVINGKTGFVSQVTNKADFLVVAVDQQFWQYRSSAGNSLSDQKSGAYIFRPTQQSAERIARSANITAVVTGPLVQEVHQDFGSNITQIVRLYANANAVEFEWTVGPLGCPDGLGKEVVTRYATDVDNDGVWYTDSNGREMQKRTRNHRDTWELQVTEDVSQNYYPVNTATYLENTAARVTVVTDRSQGGGSIDDGQLELMLHRHTLLDDSRGVGEPMAEPGVDGNGLIVRGKHLLIVTTPAASPALHKAAVQAVTYEPIPFFSLPANDASPLAAPLATSAMAGDFPPNAHLLTKQALSADRKLFLVRVNHLFEKDEDQQMAVPVTVSLADVFSSGTIANVTELKLSANQPVSADSVRQAPSAANNFDVQLDPMQIRTFHVAMQ